jgi:putative hemolysin
MTLEILLIVIPLLLLLQAVFSGSEIALLASDRMVLKTQAKEGSQRAHVAIELLDHPERIFSATLLITSICGVSISTLVTLYLMAQGIENLELTAIAVASPLIVILGELLPKTLFQRNSTRLAPWCAPIVNAVFWSFYPITRLISAYTNRLTRLVGPLEELIAGKKQTTRDQLRSLLSYSRKETEIKSSEKTLIRRILDFKDTEAQHALIPLVKVEAIEQGATIRQALERFQSHRHSRMPVYSERIDNILGVIALRDLVGSTDLEQPIKSRVQVAHYVPETQALRDLVLEMTQDRRELVVVVDEYGGAVGILTFEDIVEEIVGEIQDEDDSEALPFKILSADEWLAQARLEVSTANEHLKLAIPEGDYETLGGFLLQQFGRIPSTGDELYFDTPSGSYKFVIRKASDRSIESVVIEKIAERKSDPSIL